MKKIILLVILFFMLYGSFNFAPAKAQDTSQPVNTPDTQVKPEENQAIKYISKSDFKISVIDPTANTNPAGAYYPGLRAGNQLIIYTPAFGERTGTNEFGSEAIVINGVVTELSGSDSPIPKNGFVISGHGNAKNWINQAVTEGAVIRINPETNIIESYITPNTVTFKAKQKIDSVNKTIGQYTQISKTKQDTVAEDYLYKAMQKLNEAYSYLTNKQYDKARETAETASKLADTALYNIIPSKSGELHGVWLRPTEKDKEGIIKTLERLKKTGITNVFVESYYQGYTIFPSKTLESYGVIPQRKEFQGWDPLKIWVEEAHNRGMKVHVWFQTFYTGNEDISKNPKHVISAHPDWANVQKRYYSAERPMPSTSEHNGYFLDPANPDVQKYLSELISEIANNYDIDGLNIDYIRYPASLQKNFPLYVESTWGYSEFARNEFKNLYGVDPVNLTSDDPMWQNWVSYRQSKVTEFVSKLKSLTNKKNITLSTVIFPNLIDTSIVKLQNWGVWGCNKYVDAFTPLIMGSDEILAKNYVCEIRSTVNDNVLVYTGLFQPFTGASPSDLLYQIEAARKSGAAGIVIFDYAHLNNEFVTALKTRIFK